MGVEMGAHSNGDSNRDGGILFSNKPTLWVIDPSKKNEQPWYSKSFPGSGGGKDHNLGSYWWKHRQHTEHLSRGGSSSSKSEIHWTSLRYGWNTLKKHCKLFGGIPTPLKNMEVSWDDYSQYMNKKCSKPPSRTCIENTLNIWPSKMAGQSPILRWFPRTKPPWRGFLWAKWVGEPWGSNGTFPANFFRSWLVRKNLQPCWLRGYIPTFVGWQKLKPRLF